MAGMAERMAGSCCSEGAYAELYKRKEEEELKGSTGVLVQSINHATGQNSWKVMPTDYDYNQELARAAFADMLHDSERNQLYRAGLKAAIKQKREAGEEVHVLDIGTGTGLLSMMAAVEGADSITACEEFLPMAACAEKVIKQNGFGDQIKLVRKRSTELKVGPGLDMERRANILVTEVFDTELIGEGAISTYNHAAAELLTADRLVVPGVARIWAQAVSSQQCASWARPLPLALGKGAGTLELPDTGGGAPGSSLALHDLQLSQLPQEDFTPLSPPVMVFSMDLACYSAPLPMTDQTVVTLPALASGTCDAVLMWWDCWTDPSNTILLSCAPSWASHHPKDQPVPWRDHWMQAVYYPQSLTTVTKGQPISLVACHDEYSLWFDLLPSPPERRLSLPSPQPGLQMAMSRCRLGQLNNSSRNLKLAGVISRLVKKHPSGCKVLCLGEQSLLGLLAAKLGADQVIICCEKSNYMRDYLMSCARQNGLADKITLVDDDWLHSSSPLPSIQAVIGEPHYSSSVLPWHNLLFWFSLSPLSLPPTVTLSPHRARLILLPMHYTDLHKIRCPLGKVEGFSMDHFDAIIQAASENCDQAVEPQPLWEYPGQALALPTQVVLFDLYQPCPTTRSSYTGKVDLTPSLPLNGVALWMEWQLDETTALSSGPVSEVVVGETVSWDRDSKQGVHLLSSPRAADTLHYTATFVPSEGDFTFKFTVS